MQLTVHSFLLATHYWADAPENRGYLSFPHAHKFTVTGNYIVDEGDRQLEFHNLHASLQQLLESIPHHVSSVMVGELPTFGGMSCEHIGMAVIGLAKAQGHPVPNSVYVSEDGEFTATVGREEAEEAIGNSPLGDFLWRITRPSDYQYTRNSLHRSLVKMDFAYAYTLNRRPKTVTVCGSTKFMRETLEALALMEHRKHICLSVGYFAHAQGIVLEDAEKGRLDELHKWKIAISDYIFVVNVGGYIGSSTRSEIDFAELHGIAVEYREPVTK